MFIVTHTQQKEDKSTGRQAINPGLLFPNRDEYAEAALAAGIADERVVRCTKKHYVNEAVTACYGERQVITNIDHALRALATGKAVLDPPLGEGVEILGVVAGGKFSAISQFAPKPAEKKSNSGGKSPQRSGKPASDAGEGAAA